MNVSTTVALFPDPVVLITPVSLKRRGIELRLDYASPDARPANRDPHLIDLIRRGWAAWKKLTTEQWSANPVERSHLVRLARLRFLAPDMTLAIIDGRQPVGLTARALLRCGELPVDWDEQRKALGFAQAARSAANSIPGQEKRPLSTTTRSGPEQPTIMASLSSTRIECGQNGPEPRGFGVASVPGSNLPSLRQWNGA